MKTQASQLFYLRSITSPDMLDEVARYLSAVIDCRQPLAGLWIV